MAGSNEGDTLTGTMGRAMTPKHSERILYVEDDDDIREMMTSFLAGEGYAVSSFRTAEDGLTALEDGAFDLVLTDYILPGEDAAWLLREARARHLIDAIPVIVVSAEYKPPGIEGAAFLHKPVKAAVLLETIDRAFENRSEAGARSAPEPAPATAPHDAIELVLYIVAPSHESEAARRNLGRIVRALGPEHFRIVVRDISRGDADVMRAIEQDRIVVVPTLVKSSPSPKVWIAGDLSKRDYVTHVLTTALSIRSRGRA